MDTRVDNRRTHGHPADIIFHIIRMRLGIKMELWKKIPTRTKQTKDDNLCIRTA